MTELKITKEQHETYMKEFAALRQGIASVTLAWAQVENALVRVLTAVLNQENMRVPAAMYFSLNGIDARMRLANSAFMELVAEKPYEIVACCLWGKIMKKLNDYKKVRNKVAHGQIIGVGATNGVGRPRLTSPLLNWGQYREPLKKRQLPGMSANDLQQSQAAVQEIAKAIEEFEIVARLIHKGDEASLLQKFAELGKALQRQGSPDNRTHE